MKTILAFLPLLVLLITRCGLNSSFTPSVTEEDWGWQDGKAVKLFTLTNRNSIVLKVTNYGATITWISVPDRNGVFEPVVLGFDSLNEYVAVRGGYGSVIGRYANRIGGAQFILNGEKYTLTANSRGNTIHGGNKGFNKQVFDIDTSYVKGDSVKVAFSYLSPDMEEGFPGNLLLKVTYTLTVENEVVIDYEATTDKPTVVNFTNHAYFNLGGCRGSILDHYLMVVSDSICEIDIIGLPTGRLLPVAGTAWDFNYARLVGSRIDAVKPGYDNTYMLRREGDGIIIAAEVYDTVSGRVMEAFTTEPGMQLYTSNSDRKTIGHDGNEYGRYYGICLEMQHFPDSPNHPNFPNVVLDPNETYRQTTIYKFSTK
ncbi:MAG TPA: aldose epimerase family protein [Bacteroidales bacterium]|nr:aldose epimerase family protein [Bacteroidales bacterium]